jgi:predicted dehydrogenase
MDSPIGFGVIGVGTWGELHARTYASTPGARTVALCDLDLDRATKVNAAIGSVAKVYRDYRDLLADPAVFAVSIVLPDFLHRDAAIAAAHAGKHILLEKPLATTEEDARAILQAVSEAGVTLMVDFHNRWSPPFNALKTALDTGELGALRTISYRLNDTLYVPTQMLRWSAQSSVAWFLASHCLDTFLWLTGARQGLDAVERVFCVKRSRVLDGLGIQTPDFYQTLIEFHSGLVAHLENAWILPEGAPSVFELKCECIGERGAFYIDGNNHGAQKIVAKTIYPDNLVAPTIHGTPTGFAAESIRHFARSVIQGTPPMLDGLDGLAVTRLILAMETSASSGQPIPVGDLWQV